MLQLAHVAGHAWVAGRAMPSAENAARGGPGANAAARPWSGSALPIGGCRSPRSRKGGMAMVETLEAGNRVLRETRPRGAPGHERLTGAWAAHPQYVDSSDRVAAQGRTSPDSSTRRRRACKGAARARQFSSSSRGAAVGVQKQTPTGLGRAGERPAGGGRKAHSPAAPRGWQRS